MERLTDEECGDKVLAVFRSKNLVSGQGLFFSAILRETSTMAHEDRDKGMQWLLLVGRLICDKASIFYTLTEAGFAAK